MQDTTTSRGSHLSLVTFSLISLPNTHWLRHTHDTCKRCDVNVLHANALLVYALTHVCEMLIMFLV